MISVPRTIPSYMVILCLVFVFLAVLSTEARADLFGFAPISDNSGVSGALSAQLSVNVTEYGTNQVLFTFYNDGPSGSHYDVIDPLDSIITGVYFDDADEGALYGLAAILDADFDAIQYPGVYFEQPATPNNLPGGGSVVPAFQADFSASSEKGKGGVAKGVNPGESLGIVCDLSHGYDFADVIGLIGLGASSTAPGEGLRIGVRAQNLGEDGEFSDALLHTPTPGALILGLLGLSVAGAKLRKSV